MKKFTFAYVCIALAISSSAQAQLRPHVPMASKLSPYGMVIDNGGVKLNHRSLKMKAAKETPTVDELLGCPQGTVYGGEYNSETAYWTGTYSADEARQDMSTSFFQYFSDNSYTFTGVRFVGTFNYFDSADDHYGWFNCDSRGEIDEDGEMTEPIRIHIGFWDVNEKGLPGKEVWGKDFDIVGENTGVVRGDEYAGYNYLYSFSADLGETIKMEHGFMQIHAVDMKEDVSCYLALFTAGSSKGYGLVRSLYQGENEYGWMGCDPTIFCFKGDGSFIAKKAIKLNGFISPESTADSKFTKVSVDLSNIGSEPVSTTELQLIVDGKEVATERLYNTIGSLDSYKYTFQAPADLSAPGEHTIVVKNVTPGDEKIAAESISTTTTTPVAGQYGESKSEDEDHLIYMTNVKVGEIDNASEASLYSDFTDKKATIEKGDSLELSVKFDEKYATMSKAKGWIDWNNDGRFDDATESINFTTNDTAVVTVPDYSVEPGEKRMRIIASHYYYIDGVESTGTYDYGETEDYTIVLKRKEDTPAATVDTKSVSATLNNDSKNVAIEIGNNGNRELTADMSVNYVLPGSPINDNLSDELTTTKAAAAPANLSVRRAAAKDRTAAPEAADNTEYSLKYDKGQYDVIGITNSEQSIYATYYPGKMVANLKGMQLSSVDVYLGTPAKNSSIVIYGEKDQKHAGDLLAEQKFTAKGDSWNHVVLDNPVTLGESDLWVGVKVSGFKSGDYNMGIDKGGAVAGYGDLVNIGGDTWWSMSELGINSNYTIRANVSGERTPAIDWLKIDNSSVSVAGGDKATVGVKLDASKLGAEYYEAYIDIKTNDDLLGTVSVPVYMQNGNPTGVISKEITGGASIRFNANGVSVNADRQIASVSVNTIDGAAVANAKVNANDCTLSFSKAQKTVYVITVKYADGTKQTVKVPAL